jgi:Tol biopolymer transport system component
MLDVRRGTIDRLTSEGWNLYPAFSRDGQHVAFSSMRSGRRPSPYVTRVGSAPNAEELFAEVGLITGEPWDWSPDGKHLLFRADEDLWIVPRPGAGKPYKFAESRFPELGGAFSPDGRWIAYASTESGRAEVYVRPFPETGGVRYTVSVHGGEAAVWRRDGGELYFVSGDGWLHAVPVTMGQGTLALGTPSRLFATTVVDGMRRYEPSPDGQRFLVPTLGPEGANITVLLNWQSTLGK